MNPIVPLALVAAGVVTLVTGAVTLRARGHDGRLGRLLAVDAGRPAQLRSERYRLAGRPDALRRRPDGAVVPVELKHRPAPARGPFRSHLVQLGAYCLLVEEATGRAPPFGVLRYDDRDVVLPYDGGLRARVLSVLEASTGPYRGEADPSPAKCVRCPWSPTCEASLAGARPPAARRRVV